MGPIKWDKNKKYELVRTKIDIYIRAHRYDLTYCKSRRIGRIGRIRGKNKKR